MYRKMKKYMISNRVGRNTKENIREKVRNIQRAIKERGNETSVIINETSWRE